MAVLEPSASPATREQGRLAALKSLGILDTPPEPMFEEFARLAASIGGTPAALVSLVDESRVWFKARIGVKAAETPRHHAFCDQVVLTQAVLVVPDAMTDGRFNDHQLVAGDGRIRSYAGAPLSDAEGHVLGVVAVADHIPRDFTAEQCEALRELSRLVMSHIDLRRRLSRFVRHNGARHRVISDIRRAIDEGEFLLHYQPTVDVRTGHVASLEALIRWNNPQRGLIGPFEFLPILEDTGLIVEVGAWVLVRAADDYRDWMSRGLVAPRITVNVSTLQLRHPGFLDQLAGVLDPDGGTPAPIDIEISEQAILENSAGLGSTLQAAQRMGAQIIVDDFGTGHSSLRHLTRLPLDMIKIDRSFIANVAKTPDDMELVGAIIALAHGLNRSVAANGVETEEQRNILRLLRCDYMQGYLFSVPLPKDETEALLRADQSRATAEWQSVLEETDESPRFGTAVHADS